MSKLAVGQQVYFVPNARRGTPRYMEVLSVGRKWASLGYGLRINVETLWADGGKYVSPGCAYLSQAEYEAEVALSQAWANLRKQVDGSHRVPDGITAEQIAHIRAELFGDGA